MRKIRGNGEQRGFSLVEVTVAAAIFALGLGSLSLLLLLAVHGTIAPRSSTLASLYAHSLIESLRLVPGVEATSVAAGESTECGPAATCSPADMAGSIMESWQARIGNGIPTGRGLVCRDSTLDDRAAPVCDGSGQAIVRILWEEPDPGDGAGAFALQIPAR